MTANAPRQGPGDAPVLEAVDLSKHFPVRVPGQRGKQFLRAVEGVSLTIARGETLGLVGESGSGKTTVGRTLIRLYEPTSGRIDFEGRDIAHAGRHELAQHVRRRMAMVFQNPSTSLNPHLRVGDALAEPLAIHAVGSRSDRQEAVYAMLERVGLDAAMADRYPGELSGGQRQRIGIGRALMLDPSLVLADEPTASLDVSVQAQIVNLMRDLQDELGLAYLFITHDLALVRHLSHRIAVMYLGRLVESGPANELFDQPAHPYTAVLASMQSDREHRIVPVGDIPSPISPPSGCVFRTRCPIARDVCAEQVPPLAEVRPGRLAACHFPEELQPPAGAVHRRPVPPPMLTASPVGASSDASAASHRSEG